MAFEPDTFDTVTSASKEMLEMRGTRHPVAPRPTAPMRPAPEFSDARDVAAQAARMRAFFASGATRPIEHRRRALAQLKAYLQANEQRVLDALQADLGKAPFEGYATELGIVYEEINLCLRRLGSWMRPKRVGTPLAHFPATSKVYAEPLGVVLVMAPWNYPVQLSLVPLVDAVAAGNCVALKPSHTAGAAGALLRDVVTSVFPPEFVCCFPGSPAMNDWLLQERWDHLFFTGSARVGRLVMEAAARNLTPVTLELGGKSPCIVDRTANVQRAAQRIAWGKGVNCGQTCVAPDYLLVHRDVAEQLTAQLEASFRQYYGGNALSCGDWPHMVNRRHFDRVMGLIERRGDARVAFGGRGDAETLRIEPTCLTGVTLDDPVMGEEIFGPVLPVIEYRSLDEALDVVRTFEKPLACYVFSEDAAVQKRVLDEVPSGGACVNDVVVHLANNRMGFGGVGASGMGAYHGKVGFDCFTHYKSTLKKGTWLELPVRNPPFDGKMDLLKRFMN